MTDASPPLLANLSHQNWSCLKLLSLFNLEISNAVPSSLRGLWVAGSSWQFHIFKEGIWRYFMIPVNVRIQGIVEIRKDVFSNEGKHTDQEL